MNQFQPPRTRYWPLAVAVSGVVHLALLAGAALLPAKREGRAAAAQAPVQVNLLMVEDGPGGEATFVAAFPASAGKRAKSSQSSGKLDSSEASEHFEAKLAAPVFSGGATDHTNLGGGTAEAPGIGRGGQGRGQGGVTKFFHVPAPGQRIVYIVDASASMGKNGAWAAARDELTRSARELSDGAQFQIILYNSRARFLLPRFPGWLNATPELLGEVAAALGRVFPEGTTDHAPALRQALSLRPDTVFFLTDADDLKQEHLYLANQLNHGRAVIHTIELTVENRQRPGMPLQLLAGHNRGVYQAVNLNSLISP